MEKIKILWLGHSSIKVQGNNVTILCDPWIKDNPACILDIDDIKDVSVVCVTHGHSDHLGDSIPIVKKTGAKLVCSPEIAFYAEKKGLTYDQESYPMNIGGSWRTKDFTITMVNAIHTSDIMGEEFEADGTIIPGSGCCGYILDFYEGPTIYYSGDTGVFGDMAIIRDLYAPDVAIFSVGGKYNMGYREAAYAASLVIPDYLIPIHHGTFEDQSLDLEMLEAELGIRAPRVRLIGMKPGECFEVMRKER